MAKSDKHIQLQRRSLIWLENKCTQRGIRGCEEVILKPGYVCDAAAICGLQFGWQKLWVGDGIQNHQSDDYSFVFETKVSRADYLSTFRSEESNRLEQLANFHFIVAAKGVVNETEVPEMWGLLVESGQGLKICKQAPYVNHDIRRLHEFAYILLRSGHNRKFTYCKEVVYNQHLI